MQSTFVKVLLASFLMLVLGLLLSWFTAGKAPAETEFPWKIESTIDGSIKIFQVHIGVSTLGEFIQRYRVLPELTLFVAPAGDAVIEAYFDSLTLGGIKAKVILSLNVNKTTLDEMYNRGIRISTLGSGTRKVDLSSDDVNRLNVVAISGITYIPSINLDDALVQKRFGEPKQKITDSSSGAVHWLYPELGLDIALSEKDKEIFQYVHPQDFDKIMSPLTQAKPKESLNKY
jgi:hypothetical protein